MTAAKSTPAVYVCPDCGFRTPFEVAIQHDAARDAISRCMRSHGELGAALMTYIALHRPRQRSMTWEKTARLLTEVLDMIDAGYVVVDGQRHAATRELWIEACAAVKDASTKTLTLPLDGHGYILRILVSLSTKARAAGVRQSESIARGETPVGYSAAHAPVNSSASSSANSSVLAESLRREESDAVQAEPTVDRRKDMLAAFGQLKMGMRAPKPVVDPDREAAKGINPREEAKPKATVPTFADIDGKRQLVEVIARKGKNVTVKLLEAAEGFENTVTIPVRSLV